MMFTKFKIGARNLKAEIEEVEILRETEQCVFLPTKATRTNPKGESRELKVTEWHEYHDTWESAHASLTKKAAEQVTNARRRLDFANAFAGNVKGMKRAQTN